MSEEYSKPAFSSSTFVQSAPTNDGSDLLTIDVDFTVGQTDLTCDECGTVYAFGDIEPENMGVM